MEENKYLNEEQYKKSKKKLRIIGISLIILGIFILVSSGLIFVKFLYSAEDIARNQNPANGLLMIFGSVLLFAIGSGVSITSIILLLIANRREIEAYGAQSTVPIKKEIINEVAPSVGNAAKEVAKGVKEGLEE